MRVARGGVTHSLRRRPSFETRTQSRLATTREAASGVESCPYEVPPPWLAVAAAAWATRPKHPNVRRQYVPSPALFDHGTCSAYQLLDCLVTIPLGVHRWLHLWRKRRLERGRHRVCTDTGRRVPRANGQCCAKHVLKLHRRLWRENVKHLHMRHKALSVDSLAFRHGCSATRTTNFSISSSRW